MPWTADTCLERIGRETSTNRMRGQPKLAPDRMGLSIRSGSLVEAGSKQAQSFFDVCRRNGAIAQHDPGWWAHGKR